MKPLLPSHDKIVPYLKKIDFNRYYSNVGPLVLEYERRLKPLVGPCVTVSSCTSGLTACLLALNLTKGSFISCPSWTFVATAAAIVAAGHIPYFTDVSENWESIINTKCKAAIVVMPFGAPISTVSLEEAPIPVIIDAAGGFDTMRICKPVNIPIVISTHATKVFGTGEGGIVSCTDTSILKKIREISNFGMDAQRQVRVSGINAKLSEYAAAVGLAELDSWATKRFNWMVTKNAYISEFKEFDTPVHDDRWASYVFPVKLKNIDNALKIHGVRRWVPVHKYPPYRDYPRTPMKYTDELENTVALLPYAIDSSPGDIYGRL